MRVSDLIKALEVYPKDMEVRLSDFYFDECKNIFKISQVTEEPTGEDILYLTSEPSVAEDIKALEKRAVSNFYNTHDDFYLHNSDGDCIIWNNNSYKEIYKNINTGNAWGDVYHEFEDNFSSVGGLKKILNCYPNSMKVNLQICDGESGVIHKIYKKNVGYFTGTMDNVEEEYYDELFLEFGFDCYGGGSVSMEGSQVPYDSMELFKCLAKPIKDKFHNNNTVLSEKENQEWGEVIVKQRENLLRYYNIRRRLDASLDSNGLYHLKSNDFPFKIYGKDKDYYKSV